MSELKVIVNCSESTQSTFVELLDIGPATTERTMSGLAYDLQLLAALIENDASNYVVSFLLYDINHRQFATPEEIVHAAISGANIGNCAAVAADEVLKDVRDGVDYKGDESHGPGRELFQSKQFVETRVRVLAGLQVILENADRIVRFSFREGHPAYPVFWDFAFVIGGRTNSFILVGSSSD